MTDNPPVVLGYCPACGTHDSLRLINGVPTCRLADCPDDQALGDIIDPPEGPHITDHLVRLDRDYITVQHPLIERVDGVEGQLFGCVVAQAILDAGRSSLPDGTYAVQVTDLADHPNDWHWERIR